MPENSLFPDISTAPIGTSSIAPQQVLRQGYAPQQPRAGVSWLEHAYDRLARHPSQSMVLNTFVREPVKNLLGLAVGMERARQGRWDDDDVGALVAPGMATLGAWTALRPPAGAGVVQSIGGPAARTADLDALARAKRMADYGAAPERIYGETGWFKGLGTGKKQNWMFEIPDHNMRLFGVEEPLRYGNPLQAPGVYTGYVQDAARLPKYAPVEAYSGSSGPNALWVVQDKWQDTAGRWQPARIGNVVEHPELFAAYPELAGLKVRALENYAPTRNLLGRHNPGARSVTLAPQTLDSMERTILHELTHGVQDIEGLPYGGSPRQFLPRNYAKVAPQITEATLAARTAIAKAVSFPTERLLFAELEQLQMPRAPGTPPPASPILNALSNDPAVKPLLDTYIGAVMRYSDLLAAERGARQKYDRLHGEEVARTVERRRDMTPRERKATPFWYDYDTPLLRHTDPLRTLREPPL